MKRHGNLYEKICSMDNLYLAFRHAKKGKGWYKEVQQLEQRLYYYLAGLQYADDYYNKNIKAKKKKKGGKKNERVQKSTQYTAA